MSFDFAAGCIGGCAGVAVGHPFDTIKVHMQTQDFRNPQYKGTLHCFKSIIARDSVSGLYRGMSSPMAGVAVVSSIMFGVYGNVQRRMADPDALMSHFTAGAVAGLVQSLVSSPMELAKTRIQLQKGPGGFSNPFQCITHVAKTEGIRGVFKGLGMTALRDSPAVGTYFVSYEVMTRSSDGPISTFRTVMAGGFAGMFSWLSTYPVDVVKSRLQTDGMHGPAQYKGAMDCVRKSFRAEGYAFFTRGLSSTLLRSFPTNAATFTVVNWCFRLLNENTVVEQVYITPDMLPLTILPDELPREKSLVSRWSSGIYSWCEKNLPAPTKHRSCATYRSLLFLGAFQEAVCASEVEEIMSYYYDGDECSEADLQNILISTIDEMEALLPDNMSTVAVDAP